jgi:uncharacterized protein
VIPAAALPAELAHPRHRALWPIAAAACPPGELAHDPQHLLRVHRWALRLAPEAGVDADLAGAAALVHDLVFVPKDSDQRSTGGERSTAAAPAALRQAGYDDAEIAAIADAVRTCSWSRGLAPTAPLGALLQDADRLDAIGAIGLARVYACAQFMSTAAKPGLLQHPTDPAGDGDRGLDDRRQAADHLRLKLLKVAAGMHFPTSQAEARRRHAHLLAHLEAVRSEAG